MSLLVAKVTAPAGLTMAIFNVGQLVVMSALFSSAMAWNIPLAAKNRSPSQSQVVPGVFGHTVQFRTKGSVSRVKCPMSGAEQKAETSGFVQGALLRMFGPTAILFTIALEGHIQVTGPWSKLDLVDALMAFTEITFLSEVFCKTAPRSLVYADWADLERQLVQGCLLEQFGHSNICF